MHVIRPSHLMVIHAGGAALAAAERPAALPVTRQRAYTSFRARAPRRCLYRSDTAIHASLGRSQPPRAALKDAKGPEATTRQSLNDIQVSHQVHAGIGWSRRHTKLCMMTRMFWVTQ